MESLSPSGKLPDKNQNSGNISLVMIYRMNWGVELTWGKHALCLRQEETSFRKHWVNSWNICRPKGMGSTMTLNSQVPDYCFFPYQPWLFSIPGCAPSFWQFSKHCFLQNPNIPEKLMCMLLLVFSPYPHSTRTSPSLPWYSTGLFPIWLSGLSCLFICHSNWTLCHY